MAKIINWKNDLAEHMARKQEISKEWKKKRLNVEWRPANAAGGRLTEKAGIELPFLPLHLINFSWKALKTLPN